MSDDTKDNEPIDELRDRRWIALAREHFNPPPAVPSEELWAAIEGVLKGDTPGEASGETGGEPASMEGAEQTPAPASPQRGRASGWNTRSWGWAAAAVLVLTTGVIAGRWSAGPVALQPGAVSAGETVDRGPQGGAFPVAPADTRVASSTLQRAAVEHLDRTEAFLVGVRADAGRGGVDPSVSVWAGDLLLETRLLLDSPAMSDEGLAGLLRDLEWILVQVNALPTQPDRRTEELQLLTDGMDEQDVLFRLRARAPVHGFSAM